MSITTILAWLILNWFKLFEFFGWLYELAKNVIFNVGQWIEQARQNAVNQSYLHTVNAVAGGIALLQLVIKTGNDLIHGRITNVVVDLLLIIRIAKFELEQLVEVTKNDANRTLNSFFEQLRVLFTTADTVLKVYIDSVISFINARIDTFQFEFNKIISVVGLSIEEKRRLLKLFLDDPIGFIASVFFEIALPLLIYEIAKGMAGDKLDIGTPPVFGKNDTGNAPDKFGVQ